MSGKLIYPTRYTHEHPLYFVMAEYIAKGDNHFHRLASGTTTFL